MEPLTKKKFDGDGKSFFHLDDGSDSNRRLQGVTFDLFSNFPVADLCDFHLEANMFDPLTVSLTNNNAIPTTALVSNMLFKIESAKGITFTFSTCGQTDQDTYLRLENSDFSLGADDNCPGAGSKQAVLTWTFHDNDEYYLNVWGWESLPFTTNIVWSTDKYWSHCFETCGQNILGPTIALSCGDDIPLKCCNSSTGNIGPECCGTTPCNPAASSCCGDGSLVTGVNNEAAYAPSTAPSSPPTPIPSTAPSSPPTSLPSLVPSSQPTTSFPSSQPSDSTCDNGNPCYYEFNKEMNIVEPYFPVCIQDTKKGKLVYRQECYPSSILAGVGPADPDPEHPNDDDRFVIECGCCPTEGLPPSITDVKDVDKVPACNKNSKDCIAEGFRPSKVSKSGKKAYMDYCIDGSDEKEENFYIKEGDKDVTCGTCGMMI